ncbi:periplasmic heavy metal sensor [Pseudodesulfovibrio cashew]|uniref:Periplasmic heavy metal sensor n=1 Tax=Pseudodesulfovibrio cashew TaxID=2678688 RepID=A0A6I6JC47_9BACT|nr:periplasmic heavy metal sensor [Pseudodesulfovibrio cashew]QGY39681.1 periplasmic heavy metal sensor [Pseudodesulfovibrio cashew]
MKRFTALVFGLAMLLVGSMAFAQMGYGHGYHMGGQGYAQDGRGYPAGQTGGWGLSKEQQQAYQTIAEKYRPQLVDLTNKLWARRALLNAELAQEKIDRKKVTALAGETGDLMKQCHMLQVEMQADMREQGLPYYGMGMMHGGYGMMGGGMGYMHGGMMGGNWGSGMRGSGMMQ